MIVSALRLGVARHGEPYDADPIELPPAGSRSYNCCCRSNKAPIPSGIANAGEVCDCPFSEG